MRTETITRNIYSFDELSDEAKKKAHTDYLNRGNVWFWEEEAEATIKEVEKLFHITLKDWSIGSYRPKYPNVDFDDWWYNSWREPAYELSGNRARAFLLNNFGNVLMQKRHKYFCKDKNGKRFEAVGMESVMRESNVFYDRVYDGTCPLTGVYFDCCALDPLAYFCFGVEWDEKTKKRVMTKDRTIANDNNTTVEDVIGDCVHEMFRAFNADVEACESMEYFAEECKANDWEFLEDGTMC